MSNDGLSFFRMHWGEGTLGGVTLLSASAGREAYGAAIAGFDGLDTEQVSLISWDVREVAVDSLELSAFRRDLEPWVLGELPDSFSVSLSGRSCSVCFGLGHRPEVITSVGQLVFSVGVSAHRMEQMNFWFIVDQTSFSFG